MRATWGTIVRSPESWQSQHCPLNIGKTAVVPTGYASTCQVWSGWDCIDVWAREGLCPTVSHGILPKIQVKDNPPPHTLSLDLQESSLVEVGVPALQRRGGP